MSALRQEAWEATVAAENHPDGQSCPMVLGFFPHSYLHIKWHPHCNLSLAPLLYWEPTLPKVSEVQCRQEISWDMPGRECCRMFLPSILQCTTACVKLCSPGGWQPGYWWVMLLEIWQPSTGHPAFLSHPECCGEPNEAIPWPNSNGGPDQEWASIMESEQPLQWGGWRLWGGCWGWFDWKAHVQPKFDLTSRIKINIHVFCFSCFLKQVFAIGWPPMGWGREKKRKRICSLGGIATPQSLISHSFLRILGMHVHQHVFQAACLRTQSA